MTITYTADVANGSSFGCFWKILLRWKGSVYKLVWRELAAYLMMYFIINFSYRYGMDADQRSVFEKVKVYCNRQIESIPMSFVLGFYVTLIVKRWWDQYWILPLPDAVALFISSSIHGQDERGRILRRTIMRYVVLAYIIMLQRISFRVKKRFPSLQHLVDAGLMMESEKKIFDNLNAKTKVNKFFLPIIWSTNLVNRARIEGRIHSDHMVQSILTELNEFRRRLGRVNVYDTISVPLVYTQVVTMAVYTYFIAALLGHQWVHPHDEKILSAIYPSQELDLYFPIFLCLQFVFYIGWLKVAETLINPFGEDDDDFEINWLIDRHLQVSYLVVDEVHEEHPELLKDQYWDQVVPAQLPYNQASENFRRKEPMGSTASMKIKESETVYGHLPAKRNASMIPDEVYADYESVTDSPLVDNRKSWIQRQLSRVESFRSTSSSSSLFNRARGASGRNPPGHSHHPGAGGHRLSLYEKLMNRRSSKEHINAMRYSPRIPPSTAQGKTEKEISTSSLNPNSVPRPRVPTPEVLKESSINPIDVKFLNSRQLQATPRQLSPASLQNGYGVTSYQGKIAPTMLSPYGIPSPRSKSPLSSLYDINENSHAMLSPIEENDGSPYSTSSTARSAKSSSNYPTTTSIFGRKQSPPPPQDELPPIPQSEVNKSPSTSSSNNNSSRSDSHIVDMNTASQRYKDSGGANNNISNQSSIDVEERYMTIAEIQNEIVKETNKASPGKIINQSSDLSNASRDRKQSFITSRQNAIIEEDYNHNLEQEQDTGDDGSCPLGEKDSMQNNRNNVTENNDYDTEIMLTNEVLGNAFPNKKNNSTIIGIEDDGSDNEILTKLNQLNNETGINSEGVSRKASESPNIVNNFDTNSRKSSEVSNSNNNSNFDINSRPASQSSNNNNNINNSSDPSHQHSRKVSVFSSPNFRKLSDLPTNSGSRKSSEVSNSQSVIGNSRKSSEMSNSPNSVGNSRKVSEISTGATSHANSRKNSEISNGPNSATNSRKSSEIPNRPPSVVNSRKISELSNGSELASNSRKTSEISNSPRSRKTSEMSNSSTSNLNKNSRKTSEMSNHDASRKTSEMSIIDVSRKTSEMSNHDASRKTSEISNFDTSRKTSEISNYIPPGGSDDSRKSSDASLSSNSTVNAHRRSSKSSSVSSIIGEDEDDDSGQEKTSTEHGKNIFEVFV